MNTAQIAQAIEWRGDGVSVREIAQRLDVPRSTVQSILKRNGVETRSGEQEFDPGPFYDDLDECEAKWAAAMKGMA